MRAPGPAPAAPAAGAPPRRVGPAELAGLDEPVRRHLSHALRDGAPAGVPVRLVMNGRIRVGPLWLPFTARETIDGRSFDWRARVGLGPLTLVRAHDRHADGRGSVEVRLFGRIPALRADDHETARSSAVRAALEAVVFAPSCALPEDGVAWRADGGRRLTARLDLPPERPVVELRIDADGRLLGAGALRRRRVGRGGIAEVPCGCVVHEERSFGDLTIPARVTVGWWYGTPAFAPFFEATIEEAAIGAAPEAAGPPPLARAREVLDGIGGAARIAAALATPGRRGRRARWGLSPADAARALPGDELVEGPRWGWTHGVEVAAPAEAVWPWLAQVGADRAGFSSYAWLENLVGCRIRNAETVRPEWQARPGDGLALHPSVPPLPIVELEPGRHLVAYAAPDPGARVAGRPWVAASWLFLVEPRGPARCRVVSRYRCACSGDLRTRLSFGPLLMERIGFAMDRRMLLGIRERAERPAPAGR